MKKILLLLLLVSNTVIGQECNPFFDIPSYELSKNKSAAIGYVSCFHARGVVAEVGYKNAFVGALTMGENHNQDTYVFFQFEDQFKNISVYGGPIYRINNNPSLLICRAGFDIRLYKRMWGTFSVIQVNPRFQYAHFGLKLVL